MRVGLSKEFGHPQLFGTVQDVNKPFGLVVGISILDTKGRRFEPQHQYVFSLSKRLIRIASVDSVVK